MKETTRIILKHGLPLRRIRKDRGAAKPDAANTTNASTEIKKPYAGNTRVMDVGIPLTEIDLQSPNSPYVIPGAWPASKQKQSPAPKPRQERQEPLDPVPVSRTYAQAISPVAPTATSTGVPVSVKAKNKEKIRRVCLSVSVSEEEEAIIREYVASKGLNFSEWARSMLFRGTGKQMPNRPVRV